MRSCFFILLLFSILSRAQDLNLGLVLCIPISNLAQDEVNNRKITSYGYKLTDDRNGNTNEAIAFNGTSDYIEIDSFGYWMPEREITISFWAKTVEVKPHFVCVMMPNDPNNRLSIVINYYHSGYKYHFWDIENTSSGRLGITPILDDNNWHHYTFTNSFFAGELQAYRDGVLIGRKYANASIYQGNRSLRIGKGDVPGSNFHGSIDEFRIYNRVLSQQEITLLQTVDGCKNDVLPVDSSKINKPCTASNFVISPNPANQNISIIGTQTCTAQGVADLYNAIGQLVSTAIFVDNEALFHTNSFASGTYFIQLKNEYEVLIATKKVLIINTP